jgi:hypothetical protein
MFVPFTEERRVCSYHDSTKSSITVVTYLNAHSPYAGEDQRLGLTSVARGKQMTSLEQKYRLTIQFRLNMSLPIEAARQMITDALREEVQLTEAGTSRYAVHVLCMYAELALFN